MARSRTLKNERLKIVPFSEKFLSERYVGWLNDSEVVRYSEQRFQKHTVESCQEYLRSFDDSSNYFWAIVAKNPSLGHIGNVNAYVDVNQGVADIGILIGEKSAQGKGYATEAMTAVCEFLFKEQGMRKITAGTISVHLAMLRVMDCLGMVDDGTRVRQGLFEGKEVDLIHRCLFKEDWQCS